MPNLTSNLTIKLTDDLSGPLKQAAASLKGFTVSAQDLQKAAKIAEFRTLSKQVDQASVAFKAAQQNVRKLAADIAASDSPTKKMQAALAAAQRQSDRSKASFVEQGQALRSLRASMVDLGLPINQVANEEARLRSMAQSATAALEHQASRANSIGARLRRGLGTVAGNVAPFFGPGILHATGAAVRAGAGLETERMRLRAAGIPSVDIAAADREAMRLAAQNPNVSRTEILERYKEARSVLLHPQEALTELPVVAQTNAALKALEAGGHVSKGSAQGLGFALKGAEVLGVAQNTQRLRGYLNAFVQAKQVMGDLITTEQIYDFATNVKSSGATLSDRFLQRTAMSLTAELRGMRAGTGVDQFVKQITGGFQGNQHAAAKEFLSLGLLNRGDFETSKTGEILGLKTGHHVAGYQLAMSDPDLWVKQYLLPAMQAHHITDEQEQLALVKKLFTSSRAADIVSKLITQAPSFANHATLMDAAYGLNSASIFRGDPTVQFDALKTSLETFAATLTSPTMQAAAHAMNSIATGLSNLSIRLDDFEKRHPDIARGLALSTIAGGAIGGTALTYNLLSGLMGGFGLKTSAAALSTSAAELSAAAVRLGAAGGVPGGKVPPVVPVGPKGGFLSTLLSPSSWLRAAPFLSVLGGAIGIATTGDVLKKTRDGRDWKQAIQPYLAQNDFTFGFGGGFRPAAPRPYGFSGGVGKFSPSGSSDGLSGGGLVGAWTDQTTDARRAGETVGRAFYDGLIPEMKNTLSELKALRDQAVAILSFQASPVISPQVPAGAGATYGGGSNGAALRGGFSDYGVAAP